MSDRAKWAALVPTSGLQNGTTTPTVGQALVWNGTNWAPGNVAGEGGVTQIIAGEGVSLDPTSGVGSVEISATNTPIGPAGGDLSGDYPNPSIRPVIPAQGPVGDAAHVAQVTVNEAGQVIALASVPIASSGGGITQLTGDVTAGPGSGSQVATLASIGSALGPIGDSTHVAAVTIDAKGRVTALTAVGIAGGAGGTVTDVATGTGLTGGPITTTGTIALANTAVTPATYGDSSHVGQFTVDQQGRITAASNVGIAGGAGGTVTDVATGTGLTGGPITTTGTIALANTAVTPGSYTNTSLTVDQQGRITAASSGGNSQYTGFTYPETYGAPTGTDDSTAIMDAYNACLPGQAVLLSGIYLIGTATPIVFATATKGVVSTPTAQLSPAASPPAVAITFGAVNWSCGPMSLPKINSFSGTAVRISGSLMTLTTGGLQGNGVGVEFYTNNSGSPLQNTVYCQNIANCGTAAIQMTRATGATGIIEGNEVYVNFIDTCPAWVNFPGSNVTTANSIIENYFECSAYDANGVHPNVVINKADASQQAQNTFVVRNGVYGLSGGDYWVKSGTSQGLDQCDFHFGPGTSLVLGGSPTTAQQYQVYTNPEGTNAYGSSIRLGAAIQNPGTVPAITGSNRSNFNSGNAIYTNRINLTFAISGLANGAIQTFYAYSPLAQGTLRATLNPSPRGGSMLGCIVDSITQTGIANEIQIVLRNVSGATISSGNITMLLTIGIP